VAVSNLIRLLDLPDEALELIEQGLLSEGHGRALLLAEDQLQRRTLARAAAQAGWSVRELEARARSAGASTGRADTRRAQARWQPHPDQLAAAQQIEDTLESLLGRDIEVVPGRREGFRVQLAVDSLEDALELARRLRIRAAA
jgi:ParB family chromosome partitioning protein